VIAAGFQVNRFSADVDAGFGPCLNCPPFFNQFPLVQQIFNRLHLQFQLVFKWFSTLVRWQFQQTFNRWFSAGCVGSFSTGFQLVAIAWQWSFHVTMAIVAINKEEESSRVRSSRS